MQPNTWSSNSSLDHSRLGVGLGVASYPAAPKLGRLGTWKRKKAEMAGYEARLGVGRNESGPQSKFALMADIAENVVVLRL